MYNQECFYTTVLENNNMHTNILQGLNRKCVEEKGRGGGAGVSADSMEFVLVKKKKVKIELNEKRH